MRYSPLKIFVFAFIFSSFVFGLGGGSAYAACIRLMSYNRAVSSYAHNCHDRSWDGACIYYAAYYDLGMPVSNVQMSDPNIGNDRLEWQYSNDGTHWGSYNSDPHQYWRDIMDDKFRFTLFGGGGGTLPGGVVTFTGTGRETYNCTCTSWAYSPLSPTPCPPSGRQTRTVLSSSPSGCTGGSPDTSPSCTYTPPSCGSFSVTTGTAPFEIPVTSNGLGGDTHQIIFDLGASYPIQDVKCTNYSPSGCAWFRNIDGANSLSGPWTSIYYTGYSFEHELITSNYYFANGTLFTDHGVWSSDWGWSFNSSRVTSYRYYRFDSGFNWNYHSPTAFTFKTFNTQITNTYKNDCPVISSFQATPNPVFYDNGTTLSWAASGDISGGSVLTGDGTKVWDPNVKSGSFLSSGLKSDTTFTLYSYGPYSTAESKRTVTISPPPDPADAQVKAIDHGFKVTWSAPSPAPSFYNVYESSDPSFANTIPIKTTSLVFSDNRIQNSASITDANPLYYKIVSVNDNGQKSLGVFIDTKGLSYRYSVSPTITGAGFVAGASYTVALVFVDTGARYNCESFTYVNSTTLTGRCDITDTPTGIFDVEVTMLNNGQTTKASLPSGFQVTYPQPVPTDVSITNTDLSNGTLTINSIQGDNLFGKAVVNLVVRNSSKKILAEQYCFNLGIFDYFTYEFPGNSCPITSDIAKATGGDYSKIEIKIANDANSTPYYYSPFPSFTCNSDSWTPSPSTVCSGVSFTQTNSCGASKSQTSTGIMSIIWTPSPSATYCPANSPLHQTSTNCVNPNTGEAVSLSQDVAQGVDCASGQVCQNSNCITPIQICTPEPDATFCSRLSKNCGSVTAADNCGTSRTANCGSCTSPNTCGGGSGGGFANICGCTPTWTPDPSSVSECTTLTQTSSCGGTRSVSGTKSCGGSYTCVNKECCTENFANPGTCFIHQ
jgi:hypothetical protein